jgi:hypothetical protein
VLYQYPQADRITMLPNRVDLALFTEAIASNQRTGSNRRPEGGGQRRRTVHVASPRDDLKRHAVVDSPPCSPLRDLDNSSHHHLGNQQQQQHHHHHHVSAHGDAWSEGVRVAARTFHDGADCGDDGASCSCVEGQAASCTDSGAGGCVGCGGGDGDGRGGRRRRISLSGLQGIIRRLAHLDGESSDTTMTQHASQTLTPSMPSSSSVLSLESSSSSSSSAHVTSRDHGGADAPSSGTTPRVNIRKQRLFGSLPVLTERTEEGISDRINFQPFERSSVASNSSHSSSDHHMGSSHSSSDHHMGSSHSSSDHHRSSSHSNSDHHRSSSHSDQRESNDVDLNPNSDDTNDEGACARTLHIAICLSTRRCCCDVVFVIGHILYVLPMSAAVVVAVGVG